MSYVEWLRVRNCLRVVAIVLGVMILAALVLRIVFAKEIGSTDAIINHLSMSSGTTVSHTTLADGTPRTILDNPAEHKHVVIDGGGSFERTITVTEPANGEDDNFTAFSVEVRSNEVNGIRTVVINTNSAVPIWFYFAFAGFIAFIVATCLAGSLARENDGHGEIAMTRPALRMMLATQTIGVDIAGIALSILMTVVALIICQTFYELQHFKVDAATFQVIAMVLAAPFAWYAIITAATASMKRGYGAVIGFAWPVAIVIAIGGLAPWPHTIFGQTMHWVFMPISYLDPIRWMVIQMHVNDSTGMISVDPGANLSIAMQVAFFIVYSTIAVIQWQKVEA